MTAMGLFELAGQVAADRFVAGYLEEHLDQLVRAEVVDLEEVAQHLLSRGAVDAYLGDGTVPALEMLGRVQQELGAIDILVTSAGAARRTASSSQATRVRALSPPSRWSSATS